MIEPNNTTKYFVDKPAQERFRFVIEKGKEIFANSALVNPSTRIGGEDIELIAEFHKEVAPTNPSNSWRLQKEDRPIEKDPSFFSNWEAPGGPLEHITLASKAAEIITRALQEHARFFDESTKESETVEKLKQVDPLHAAAAAALHDEGREVTHIFYTTDLIGRAELRRIGVRKDLLDVLPNEDIYWLSPEDDMNFAIAALSLEEIIIRIADDYGKRKAGTNRLKQRADFTQENQEKWAASYVNRPDAGRPSDRLMRSKMPLHTQNTQRYLDALSKWINSVSTLTIDDITKILHEELSPTLPPLSENILLSSGDMIDGEVTQRKIELDGYRIEVKAVTQIGGPNKKFNEDGGVVLSDGSSISVVVVDGGTQIEQVPSLGDLSGGAYIREKVEEYTPMQSPNDSPEKLLQSLNFMIGQDMRTNHPEIKFQQDSRNIPYGCIAAVRVDTKNNTVEIANAGDVSIVILDKLGNPRLVSHDSIYEYDQRSFAKAQELAKEHGITTREALEHAMGGTDVRFSPILDQMLETMKASNSGKIERIMGLDVFSVHQAQFSLESIGSILVFTDGVVPAGIDVHSPQGLEEFTNLIKSGGFKGLLEERRKRAAADPNFEKNPRFRDIDDMLLVQINI